MENRPVAGAQQASRPAAASKQDTSSSPLGPFVLMLLVWMSVWWLVVGVLLHPVLPGGWLTVLATAFTAAAPLVPLIWWFTGGIGPPARARLWVLRPFWYVQLLLPLVAVAGLAGALAGLPFGASGRLGRLLIAVVAAGSVGLALVGYLGSRRLVTRHFDVSLEGLPEALDGLRIVQLSDLHVGPHTSRSYLARIVEVVRDAQPHLIAVTGDQVDDYAQDVVPFAAAFESLSAPLGVFAIAGNHDVYAGWAAVRAGLETMGIRVLVNEALRLEWGGTAFWLAGTGDPAGKAVARGGGAAAAPDVARTLARVAPGAFVIVLAHNPALWPALAERGVPLTLSGHTHYGQLAIPRLGWSLASPFLEHAMGTHRKGASLLYINPGTNYWGIPFRIGTPPEITVLTLRGGGPGESSITPGGPA